MFSSPRVLFICVHNGGRSQMCEAFPKHYADDRFDAQSAGLEPGELNPLAVEAGYRILKQGGTAADAAVAAQDEDLADRGARSRRQVDAQRAAVLIQQTVMYGWLMNRCRRRARVCEAREGPVTRLRCS